MVIITDSDRDSKSSPVLSESTDVTRTGPSTAAPPPPAYRPASRPSISPPLQMPLTPPSVEVKEREPAWRRFFKALSVAAIVYLLLGVVVKSSYNLVGRHLVEGVPEGPRKSDGRVILCANDTLRLEVGRQLPPTVFPPYSSTMSFSLPVSSSLVFLLSRGSYDDGSSVHFELSENSGDSVEIEVIASYYSNSARNRARVCLLEREEGGKGVGFFTPRRLYSGVPQPQDRVRFTTTIRFPKSGSSRHPLIINALETQMGAWSHHINALENRVVFRSVSLHASDSPIRVDYVSADVAKLQTSNSPITGSYNVSDSLILTTTNSPITANIRLENRDGHKPTQLELNNRNGRIQAPITLVSTDKYSYPPPAFSISARTSNSALNITFSDAPPSPFSHLQFVGRTSNAPANVKLHTTFEGTIFLKTSTTAIPALIQKPGSQDPGGQGRYRTVDVRKFVRGTLEADVWWGNAPNQDEERGKVVIATSNSNAVAELG